MERSLLPSLGGSIGTNLEPPLYRAPIAGGKDDGVERILPACRRRCTLFKPAGITGRLIDHIAQQMPQGSHYAPDLATINSRII